MARKMFGGGHEPDGDPTAQSHGEDMMATAVRPHKRKGKRGGGRKHSRKDGKRY